MTKLSLPISVHKVRDDSVELRDDRVAVEEPLEIRLGFATPEGRTTSSVSVTMRTPGNDLELALGFLFSESIIRSRTELAAVEHSGPVDPESGNRNIVRVDLQSGISVDLGKLKRHFYTTSSCGVCGKTSLDALAVSGAKRLKDSGAQFDKAALVALPNALRARQKTFDETGGLHAAAVFDQRGDIKLVREDVGRHNAVDKVVGALLQADQLPGNDLGLLVSGRASFELLQKTLVAGIPVLAAVSAPSSLAIQLAEEFNVTLIGFLRGETFNIYNGVDRIR